MTRRLPRRLAVLGIVTGSTVLVAACVVAGVLAAPRPGQPAAAVHTPPTASHAVPSASPGTAARVTGRTLTTTSASVVVGTYVAAVDRFTPTSTTTALEAVVTGKALDEVQAQLAEFHNNGWTATGTPRVTSVKVLRTGTNGTVKTAEVQACVDSSKVRLVTSSGKPVFPPSSASRRALNLYDLAYASGGWRIVRHTFPTNPAC